MGQSIHFCKVADIKDWEQTEFQIIEALLQLNGRSRKAWEFIQVYVGLQQLGLLNGEAKAIGLGVGSEPLIYAFTNVCQQVVATDLYESQQWSTAAMATEEIYQRNPFPYQVDRLTVRHMDMTQIEYPDASFDFVWSCCSIEHVNSFPDLYQVYAEIHRVLKPGGIAALTTEYNPTDLHSYEPNMLFTDRHWIDKWLTGNNPLIQGFDLLDDIDLSVSSAPENQPKSRRTAESSIQIYAKDIFLNSVAFFLRKAGEFSQRYDDSWLPLPLATYLAGCDAERLEDFEQAKTLLQQILQDQSIDSRLRVGTARHLLAVLNEQQQLQEVIQVCRDIFPYCAEVQCSDHLLAIAHACRKAGLWEEAKFLYEKIEQLPGAALVQVIRCVICQAEYFSHQSDHETALELMEKARQLLTPNAAEENQKVYQHIGIYNERLQRFEVAIAAYRQAAELGIADPKFHANCQLRISKCLQKKADLETQKQEAIAPQNNSSPSHLGWLVVKNFLRKLKHSFKQ